MNRRQNADIFLVARIDTHNWQILNKGYPVGDGRHLVALIREIHRDQVQVEWLQTMSLPTTYTTAVEVLDAVTGWAGRASAATRPIPIPHLPPRDRRAE
ncbi:hypothetical protein [Microbacterium deminutum]|uniref:Uncharacterized protein n=1 Tax=Microbacterium deminutum TaxID=344164 RepID=A0ABP5BXS5_9MICO